jgi:hypothetical protein
MKDEIQKKACGGGDGGGDGGNMPNKNPGVKHFEDSGMTPGEAAVAWLAVAPSQAKNIIPKSKSKKNEK